jgi:hypothetical protein
MSAQIFEPCVSVKRQRVAHALSLAQYAGRGNDAELHLQWLPEGMQQCIVAMWGHALSPVAFISNAACATGELLFTGAKGTRGPLYVGTGGQSRRTQQPAARRFEYRNHGNRSGVPPFLHRAQAMCRSISSHCVHWYHSVTIAPFEAQQPQLTLYR